MHKSIGGFPGQLILTDTLTYDDQGRITGAIDSGGSSTMVYNGLGRLIQSDRMSDPSSYFNNAGGTSVTLSAELYEVDALGFVKDTDRTGLGVDGSVSRPSVWRSSYDTTGTGRMMQRGPVGNPTTSEVYSYDDAGNRALSQWTNPNASGFQDDGVTASIYGADGKLRVTDRQNCSLEQDAGTGGLVCGLNEYGRMTTFEEYRYDALGRRVMVRAQSDKGLCPGNNCPNYIQRTVWDGDQVLLEIRRPGGATVTAEELANDHGVVDLRPRVWICDPNVDPADCFDDEPPGTPTSELCQGDLDQAAIIPPGCIQVPSGPQDFFPYGVAAYIHGGELDRPLSIYRDDHSVDGSAMRIQPIANWKGDFVTGAFHDGTAADCMASAQPSRIDIQWPGERVWHGWENKDPELVQDGPRHWMGSLVYGSADASGLLYRRNRYYDPVAGQFTQEDPIGLAGGLNLYGFANGDPVNFSDPFGLMAGGCCLDPAVAIQHAVRPASGELASPGFFDPVAIATGFAGAVRNIAGRTLGAMTGRIFANRTSSSTVTFFRGVMKDELGDFLESGVLRTVNGSGGKHLATTADNAEAWARTMARLYDDEFGGVLQVTVSQEAAANFTRLGKIDGIGEAFFANLDDLADATIKVIRQ